MFCHENRHHTQASGCACLGTHQGHWLSRKKQAEALKEQLALLESRAEDIREYLRELET